MCVSCLVHSVPSIPIPYPSIRLRPKKHLQPMVTFYRYRQSTGGGIVMHTAVPRRRAARGTCVYNVHCTMIQSNNTHAEDQKDLFFFILRTDVDNVLLRLFCFTSLCLGAVLDDAVANDDELVEFVPSSTPGTWRWAPPDFPFTTTFVPRPTRMFGVFAILWSRSISSNVSSLCSSELGSILGSEFILTRLLPLPNLIRAAALWGDPGAGREAWRCIEANVVLLRLFPDLFSMEKDLLWPSTVGCILLLERSNVCC